LSRTVRDANLETRTARARLSVRNKPYYRALDEGLHLGYRKGKTSGKWVVRVYRGDQNYTVETLDGVTDDTADADGVAVLSYRQAQEEARRRYVEHRRAVKGLPSGRYTVRDAVEAQLAYLDAERKSGRDARYSAEALILPQLGDIALADLTPDRLRRWLAATAAMPARLHSKREAPQRYRLAADEEAHRRRQSTANRIWNILRAALNRARQDGKVTTDDGWRTVKSFRGADASRVRYLTLDECRRLINAAQDEFRDLVKAALLTGCRYGELTALQVRDFDAEAGTVHVHQSKNGRGRHVVLTAEGIGLFRRLTAGRAGTEPMLRKRTGGLWRRSNQGNRMAGACARAGIVPPANFHSLRHTYASHAVMAGAPLLVVAKNLGHATTLMVEKHYGHLSENFVALEIRKAAPQFGIDDDHAVTPISGRAGA
jgi:integrase